jgi:hypothetical protein
LLREINLNSGLTAFQSINPETWQPLSRGFMTMQHYQNRRIILQLESDDLVKTFLDTSQETLLSARERWIIAKQTKDPLRSYESSAGCRTRVDTLHS